MISFRPLTFSNDPHRARCITIYSELFTKFFRKEKLTTLPDLQNGQSFCDYYYLKFMRLSFRPAGFYAHYRK